MIESFFSWLDMVTGNNQYASAAISATLIASFGFMIKSVPFRCYRFLKEQITTSLTINNTSWPQREVYYKLNEMFYHKATEGFSRTLSIVARWNRGDGDIIALGVGYGRHLIFYKGRPLLITKATLDSSGGDLLKEQVQLSKLGRSHALFEELLAELREYDRDNRLKFYRFDKSWELLTTAPCGSLNQLALDRPVREQFEAEFEHFLTKEDEYHRLGLPYKMTYLLFGLPGTGKTSLIRALAGQYQMSLCPINLTSMTDKSLIDAMITVPRHSIVLIEDIDAATATRDRKENNGEEDGFLTLSGILNALDGIRSLDGCVVFMTTNYRERLDEALIRGGRVDRQVELPPISAETVRAYFERQYPGLDTQGIVWREMLAKEINGIVFEAKACKQAARSLLLDKVCLKAA